MMMVAVAVMASTISRIDINPRLSDKEILEIIKKSIL